MCALAACELVLAEPDWQGALLKNAKLPAESALVIAKGAAGHAHQAFLAHRPQHLDTGCPRCLGKEYSDPCPLTWLEREDGECVAPRSYGGPCARAQASFGQTAVDKQEAEVACQVCWPCPREAGAPDWGRPCPHGYSAMAIDYDAYASAAGVTCVADMDSQGGCEDMAEFSKEEEKREFAQRCSVSWPSGSACEDHIESICPQAWTHIGERICAAPLSYKVAGCDLLQSFHGWTPQMKYEYARRCHVVWPCEAEARGAEEPLNGPAASPKCELDLDACPRSWSPSEERLCAPSSSAAGPCTEAVRLGGLAWEERLRWAGACLLTWPCKGEVAPTLLSGARGPLEVATKLHGPVSSAGRIASELV